VQEGNCLEDLGVDGRIILEWILREWDGWAWSGFIWLRLGQTAVCFENGKKKLRSVKCG
jgi:hypothetical protein